MNIIEIKKENIRKAGEIIAQSFAGDPIFKYIFKTKENYIKNAPWLFSSWVRWSTMFGKAWMTEDGNGILLMRPPDNPRMTMASFIKAGMLPTPWKIGLKSFIRFYFKMVPLLEKLNNKVMQGSPHWYGWMICAHPEHKGLGIRLSNHCAAIADELNLPIYLETALPRDIHYYFHYGFETKEQVNSPDGEFLIYAMVRAPKPQKPVPLPKRILA